MVLALLGNYTGGQFEVASEGMPHPIPSHQPIESRLQSKKVPECQVPQLLVGSCHLAWTLDSLLPMDWLGSQWSCISLAGTVDSRTRAPQGYPSIFLFDLRHSFSPTSYLTSLPHSRSCLFLSPAHPHTHTHTPPARTTAPAPQHQSTTNPSYVKYLRNRHEIRPFSQHAAYQRDGTPFYGQSCFCDLIAIRHPFLHLDSLSH